MSSQTIDERLNDIIADEVNKGKRKKYPEMFVADVLRKFLIIPLALSALVLLLCSIWGICICVTAFGDEANGHTPNMSTVFRGLELIFISPIAFFILSAFSGYLSNVIIPSFDPGRGAADVARERLPDAFRYITIIKYLFISIVVSTLLVILLETVFNLNPFKDHSNNNNATHKTSIISRGEKERGANEPRSEVTVENQKIEYNTQRVAEHNDRLIEQSVKKRENSFTDFTKEKLPFISITVVVLIIALIYYKMLEKHLAEEMKELAEEHKTHRINAGQMLEDIKKEQRSFPGGSH